MAHGLFLARPGCLVLISWLWPGRVGSLGSHGDGGPSNFCGLDGSRNAFAPGIWGMSRISNGDSPCRCYQQHRRKARVCAQLMPLFEAGQATLCAPCLTCRLRCASLLLLQTMELGMNEIPSCRESQTRNSSVSWMLLCRWWRDQGEWALAPAEAGRVPGCPPT